MRKAVVAGLLCAALAAGMLCAGCGSNVSEEVYDDVYGDVTTYYYIYDDVTGVTKTDDGAYYTDTYDEDGNDEPLEVTLDTVIVPVKEAGKAVKGYTVRMYNDAEDGAWEYLEYEPAGKKGFTLDDLLNEGTFYDGYDDEGERQQVDDVDVESIIEDMYASVTSDDEYLPIFYISEKTGFLTWFRETFFEYWSYDNGYSIELTEDAPEYSTIEVDVVFDMTTEDPSEE